MTAQPPDQELVFFLKCQKGPSRWSPLLLLLSVWDNVTRTETQNTGLRDQTSKQLQESPKLSQRGACFPIPTPKAGGGSCNSSPFQVRVSYPTDYRQGGVAGSVDMTHGYLER